MKLQTLLEDHHDTVVARDLLRRVGIEAHLASDNAYGRLCFKPAPRASKAAGTRPGRDWHAHASVAGAERPASLVRNDANRLARIEVALSTPLRVEDIDRVLDRPRECFRRSTRRCRFGQGTGRRNGDDRLRNALDPRGLGLRIVMGVRDTKVLGWRLD